MMISNTKIVTSQSGANDHFYVGGNVTSYTAINPNFNEYKKRLLREQRLYHRAIKKIRKFFIEGFTLRDE